MIKLVRLDDILAGAEAVTATFRKWRESIELLGTWDVSGRADFKGTKEGFALHVHDQRPVRGIVTTEITAAGGVDAVGTGVATLKDRDAGTLYQTQTGALITSDASIAIPVGTKIIVAPDGDKWMLMVAFFCPEEEV